jgi:AcrR family transcriptional regulator
VATRRTQERIVDSAVELFNEYGTGPISTNRIADHSGVSQGNLHYHFRNKHEIIQCVFQRIVDEMDGEWYSDPQYPTLHRMAEMFARQAILIYDYRFFYRERPVLLRADPLLMQRYRENSARRVPVLERFFMALGNAGQLNIRGNASLISSLVQSTWIIADNCLNSIEFLGREISADSIMSGYELILDIFRPYFAANGDHIIMESRMAIRRHIEQRRRGASPSDLETISPKTRAPIPSLHGWNEICNAVPLTSMK